MPKRSLSSTSVNGVDKKRPKTTNLKFTPNKVASHDAAAAVDADPPLPKLLKAVEDGVKNPAKGESVVYWMRMGDLRITDNRALSLASEQAKKEAIPLVVLFTISPQDYIAHDRSRRRIDFTLRNLSLIKESLLELHVPLKTMTVDIRQTLPTKVMSFLSSINCRSLYANIEHEVDELRRDIRICSLAKEQDLKATFVHDKCIVEPGVVTTKENKAYAVYSPYQRRWIATLNENIPYYLEDCATPSANPESVRKAVQFAKLFESSVPESIPGFELEDSDKKKMDLVWPAGESSARDILQRFLHTTSRASQLGAVDPLAPKAEKSSKQSRVVKYDNERDFADKDITSRLSPYLSAGVISARSCVRATMALLKIDVVDAGRTTGVGRWVQELAWRDFYTNVLVSFPRVSMGRPYLEKFSDVVWENHQAPGDSADADGSGDGEMLQKWKEGKTGFPIVDAGMRCIKEMGWVHNRLRMITAMFLTKDLMMDWRVGERHFMEQLIDGDLASNNGGWQWSASTGVDPCPYFRIFNPYSQSPKADPTGDFIRHYVPELKKLKGKDLYQPSADTARALGYPLPMVDHHEARERALRRFKNPGEE